jgi:hypothetical protein
VTLDRARELLKVQAGFGGSYNAPRAGAKLSAAAVASCLRYMLPDLEKT